MSAPPDRPRGGGGPDSSSDPEGPLSFPEVPEDGRGSAPDERDPAGGGFTPPTSARPGGSRYGWLVGVAFVLLIAYAMVNGLRTEGPGSRGIAAGRPLPPFAVPLALGSLDGDANVAVQEGGGAEGRRPACEVRGKDVVNLCQLVERGPLVLAFMFTPGGRDCQRHLDVMQRLLPRRRGVQFAAVAIRGDRSRLRDLIRRRGWRFPVGYDRDATVANVYGIAVCDTVTFAYPGGIAMRTTTERLDARRFGAAVNALASASRKRGWKPPA